MYSLDYLYILFFVFMFTVFIIFIVTLKRKKPSSGDILDDKFTNGEIDTKYYIKKLKELKERDKILKKKLSY